MDVALKFQFEEALPAGAPLQILRTGGLLPAPEHSQTVPQAYLDAVGMEKVENLLRQRSVGAWFLDHLDNPLEANLPLFPPNVEAST